MTGAEVLLLAVIMSALAAMPSSSVALVVVRSASAGTVQGLTTAAGIVAGDLIFMTLALAGMTVLAEQAGAFFAVIKYAAAAYLIWFGVALIRNARTGSVAVPVSVQASQAHSSYTASFVAGLALTLGDVKAIVFYASLLPMFVDLANLSAMDVSVLAAVTVLTVGGVKALYAIAARNLVKRLHGAGCQKNLQLACGGMLTATGTYLLVKP